MTYETRTEAIERLTEAVRSDSDDTFSRANAVGRLKRIDARPNRPDVFPIQLSDNEWLIDGDSDRLDGREFISKWVKVMEDKDPCPDCGATTRKGDKWDNGVVSGLVIKCVVCDHTFTEVLP